MDIASSLKPLVRASLEIQAVSTMMQQRMPPHSDGQDASGVVDVRVLPTGVVQTLGIRFDWRKHLRPEELGDAVMSAIRGAYEAQLKAVSQAPGAFSPPRISESEVEAELARRTEEAQAGLAFGPTLDVGDAAEHYLTMARRQREAGTTTAQRTPGPGRPVVVGHQGSRIASVAIDPVWAQEQTGTAIAQEVLAAHGEDAGDAGSQEADDLLFGLLSTLNHPTGRG